MSWAGKDNGALNVLWNQLHVRPWEYAAGTIDAAFLAQWTSCVPNEGGCGCRNLWKIWLGANPAPFASREAYFEWTVRAHNVVNAKLSRPLWGTDQALDRWWPLATEAEREEVRRIADLNFFDAAWYLTYYEDLNKNGVRTELEAHRHWAQNGQREKRYPSAKAAAAAGAATTNPQAASVAVSAAVEETLLDAAWYLDRYADLRANGVSTQAAARAHWATFGRNENRMPNAAAEALAKAKLETLDPAWYLDRYPDLRQHGINTVEGALTHWNRHGKGEGRFPNAAAQAVA
ncbi:Hypothetical protein UVM_LOCUS278 [uncultured virus]|nr:Hypothetical protein UVM_LOCUS278 [uncultured virus]